jgi:hypothetical protein
MNINLKRDSVTRFSTSDFFHQAIPHRPLINGLIFLNFAEKLQNLCLSRAMRQIIPRYAIQPGTMIPRYASASMLSTPFLPIQPNSFGKISLYRQHLCICARSIGEIYRPPGNTEQWFYLSLSRKSAVLGL